MKTYLSCYSYIWEVHHDAQTEWADPTTELQEVLLFFLTSLPQVLWQGN